MISSVVSSAPTVQKNESDTQTTNSTIIKCGTIGVRNLPDSTTATIPATNATKPMMRPIVPIPGMTIEFSSGTENTKRQSSHNAAVETGLSFDDDPANGRTTLAARRIRG